VTMANKAQNVDYVTEKDEADAASTAAEDAFEDAIAPPSPIKKPSRRKRRADSESDTDFQADTEDESEPEPEAVEPIDAEKELNADGHRSTTTVANSSLYKQNGAGASNKVSTKDSKGPSVTVTVKAPPKVNVQPPQAAKMSSSKPSSGKASSRPAPPDIIDLSSPKPRTNAPSAVKPFKRVQLPVRSPLEPTYGSYSNRLCPACLKQHPQGACELKAAGVEHCGLCGLVHFGHSRTCPHIKSETQVRAMLVALKNSPEPKHIVDMATKYLRGVKGTLVQAKKKNQEKAAALNGGPLPTPAPPKPRGPPNNTLKFAHFPGATNGVGSSTGQLPNGAPQREVPSWYKGPEDGALGRSGAPRTPAEQQRMLQMQAHGQLDEHEMESALRGFLGH